MKFDIEDIVDIILPSIRIDSGQGNGKITWDLYPEQRRILEELLDTNNRNILILKIRQIGITTLCCLRICLFVLQNPGTPIAIAAQDDKTARKVSKQVKSIATQIGLQIGLDNQKEFTLYVDPSLPKTQIDVLTMNGTSAGRGNTYGLIIGTEAAYWKDSADAWNALSNAVNAEAQIILESTASAQNSPFRELWQRALPGWTRIFSGLQNHTHYTNNPHDITDQEWELYQRELAMTSRPHAAFLHKKIAKSSKESALRDYPILSAHAWSATVGRAMPIDPPIAPYTLHPLIPRIHIYHHPEPFHNYVMSLDPASGSGKDDTVIVVYDITARRIAASYTDNNTKIEDIICPNGAALILDRTYSPHMFIIEKNGIGAGAIGLARQNNLNKIVEYTATNAQRSQAFMWVRQQLKNGMCADENLLRNCQRCMVSESSAGLEIFEEDKDFLSALGFIGLYESQWQHLSSYKPPPPPLQHNQFQPILTQPKYKVTSPWNQ